MPTVTDRMPTSTTTRVAAPQCTCADCGGLECLCRPRFFAGQLLTEEELNQLDHYIVAKNRLQNRYLHGWGVVCGLDVVCDDCTTGVLVKPGYALSPCGDDIVVCKDSPVDVCSLVQVCQKRNRQACDDMSPAERRTAEGCVEAGDWVLGIRYNERSSRGVTALRGGGCACGGAKSGGCGCGGSKSSSGGCGCGGKSSGSATSNGYDKPNGGCGCRGSVAASTTSRFSSASRCAQPLECEPTIVCEEYRFEVYRLPTRKVAATGALEARFLACLNEFKTTLPPVPTTNTQQLWSDWCCRARDALLDYLATHPIYDCSLPRRVRDLACPSAQLAPAQFAQALATATLEIMTVLMAELLACICSALMPPCPDDVSDALVPLAVVSIAGTGTACHVTSICNWTTERKYATTFPSLQYWLSVLPCGRALREALEQMCCKLIPARPARDGMVSNIRSTASPMMAAPAPAPGAAPAAAPATDATASAGAGADTASTSAGNDTVPAPASAFHPSEPTIARNRIFTQMALSAIANHGESLDGPSLLRAALGDAVPDTGDALPAEATDNLLAFIALDQMVKPTLRATLPQARGITEVLGMMAAFGGARPRAEEQPSGLADEVATLRATVDRQNRAIEELRSRMDNR